MTEQRLRQIFDRAREQRVLVIGDLMLDEFVWGKVGRISPEAPVPVVEVSSESCYPGGAANVARNLREFTGHVSVAGMVGRDRAGEQLLGLLHQEKIDTSTCTKSETFPTIVKTRIIARHQQVVRVDREQIAEPDSQQIASIIAALKRIMPQIDAIIFEDYGKGFLAQRLVDEVLSAGRGKIIAVDPNPRHEIRWRGVSVMKPNRSEARHAAGINEDASASSMAKIGAILLEKWETDLVLVTLGDEGMMLFQRNAEPHHVPTRARQVFDVSGAGDTAIALFTLALSAGATPLEAADIANHASAVVVGKLGTATVSPDELIQSFANG
ncbi:MAG: D-glycero-beta-D-manno-heptose-7-phosphate kinase [Verrucomicrobia bacterium]|nr:D-glycero-beta-D-manno-heptose-7-phosphate kinase [Verrucomicrobiota bacterium]